VDVLLDQILGRQRTARAFLQLFASAVEVAAELGRVDRPAAGVDDVLGHDAREHVQLRAADRAGRHRREPEGRRPIWTSRNCGTQRSSSEPEEAARTKTSGAAPAYRQGAAARQADLRKRGSRRTHAVGLVMAIAATPWLCRESCFRKTRMKQSVKLIAGNWKMNGVAASLGRGRRPAAGPDRRTRRLPRRPVPARDPDRSGDGRRRRSRAAHVEVGGQDCHAEASGAFTGSISAEMLIDAGATLVILGHSERRAGFGETDADVAAKTEAALAAGWNPLSASARPWNSVRPVTPSPWSRPRWHRLPAAKPVRQGLRRRL
jgi:hypothetical protein